MIVDIYKRPEAGGKFSYIAVPDGKLIPEEVTNSDWEVVKRRVNFADESSTLPDFSIDNPLEQISAKGYAITSSTKLTEELVRGTSNLAN